jgi:hypothetical protein
MRWLIFAVFIFFILNESSLPQSKVKLPSAYLEPVAIELKPFFTPSKGQFEELFNGEVISEAKVTTPAAKEQTLMLFVSGLHPRSCQRAMRKLSLYENYDKYIDFIKDSKYDETTQKFSFKIEHLLLPYPMYVSFKIPRITQEGHYAFLFEHGILKGLVGKIGVKEFNRHCLLSLKSDWRGPDTRIPDFVFSTFLQTVSKMGLEHLIRVSLF